MASRPQRPITRWVLEHPWQWSIWSAVAAGAWALAVVADWRAMAAAAVATFAINTFLWCRHGPARKRETALLRQRDVAESLEGRPGDG